MQQPGLRTHRRRRRTPERHAQQRRDDVTAHVAALDDLRSTGVLQRQVGQRRRRVDFDLHRLLAAQEAAHERYDAELGERQAILHCTQTQKHTIVDDVT